MCQPQITGDVNDPVFRHKRALLAAAASNSGAGVVTRLLNALDDDRLTPDQIERCRAALDQPVKARDRAIDDPRTLAQVARIFRAGLRRHDRDVAERGVCRCKPGTCPTAATVEHEAPA